MRESPSEAETVSVVPYIVKNAISPAPASAATSARTLKKLLIDALKIVVPLLLIGWLVYDCHRKDPETFARLQPRQWSKLLAAGLCILLATCLSFTRWFLLVRALDIPFRLRDAFRLGFIGYFFNFFGPGQVGGDLFKAVFLAREQTERRAEAIATILLDRVVGLYSLLVVASVAIWLADVNKLGGLSAMLYFTQLATVVGGIGVLVLLLPGRYSQRTLRALQGIPKLGSIVTRIAIAMSMYRRRHGWLGMIAVLSLSVHVLMGLGIHLADVGVFAITPNLSEHMIMSPLAGVAGGLPLVPGGLGTYELAMRYLFDHLPANRMQLEAGQGLVVALGYRVVTISIALVGVAYYWLHRSEVRQVIAETKTP